jgi:8-oxo-dGTP pyrophosphatase MutT (NUDIX family)
MKASKKITDLLDELRAIAQIGLNYARDPYDLQRYERILQLASDQYSSLSGLPSKEIIERFSKELGYITPKIGVQGVLFNPQGQVLLEKRVDDNCWGIPSGWVEVGETPDRAIKRELFEETGLIVTPLKIIGFYTRLPGEYDQPHTSVHLLYYCRLTEGALKKSFESLAVEFCDPLIPRSWHKDHRVQIEEAVNYWKSLKL